MGRLRRADLIGEVALAGKNVGARKAVAVAAGACSKRPSELRPGVFLAPAD